MIGKLSLFLDSAGRSNGMYFDYKGDLITCADEHDQLWAISPKGKIKVLLADYHGHLLNGPNDIWIDAKGGISAVKTKMCYSSPHPLRFIS